MNKSYDHQAIEKKWKKRWLDQKTDQTDLKKSDKKFYCLDMFPYPSGEGLHVGHWRGYVMSDFHTRFQKLQNKNVFHPMGFDAFGLPAENAAIKKSAHPQEFTDQAIIAFTEQLKSIGAAYDWSKTINTSSPDYYRWTQWLFLQLYKHGLAEKRLSWVNWCPKDKTVLANEQVVSGRCERCGTMVTKKEMSQWYFLITKFAEELLDGLEDLDWPEHVKTLQRNWIGKSIGATIKFHSNNKTLEVFTTRPDTIYGVNAIILAPEHPLLLELTTEPHRASVVKYVADTKSKSELERQQNTDKAKTGVLLGSTVLHPLTHQEIPIWVADYVLPNYGTGAIMSVPAHDERDHEFAVGHNLPIIQVINDENILINSPLINGLEVTEATKKITEILTKKGLGKETTSYRLRDWLVSRQRYWGAPIPIIYDDKNQPIAISEKDLPLILPTDTTFTYDGGNPISKSKQFVTDAEVKYGKDWRYETDTLDTFVDSSWYYLRFLSPDDDNSAFNKELVEKWLPIDLYIGGIEHAILHLLYSRFIFRFLVKFGYVSNKTAEPFNKLYNIGMIGLNGAKMSKSKGNIVSPNPLVEHYGTDALRGYELFLGPMDHSLDWNPRGINGIHRFLIKLSQLSAKVGVATGQEVLFDNYLNNIDSMIADNKLNTFISEAMILVNSLLREKTVDRSVLRKLIVTLSPVFPFICEEIWEELGSKSSVFEETWPISGSHKNNSVAEIKILINQKFVTVVPVPSGSTEEQVLKIAEKTQMIQNKLQNRSITRTLFKENELLNIIVEN